MLRKTQLFEISSQHIYLAYIPFLVAFEYILFMIWRECIALLSLSIFLSIIHSFLDWIVRTKRNIFGFLNLHEKRNFPCIFTHFYNLK